MATENFDDAFATLIRDETGVPASQRKDVPTPPPAAPAPAAAAAEAPETPPPPAPEAQSAQATPEGASATATPGEGDPPSEIEGVDEGAATGGEPPPPPEQKSATDDALARLADMLSQRQPAPSPARTEQPAAPPPPAFSPEEVAFLTQYQTDFPDVARAEATIRRAEYNALTAHIFREMANYFSPHIALLQQLADNTAYNQVIQRVPNYDEVRDQMVEWVKTQPTYLQGGMNHVIAQGTAEEIADLYGRFTQATGAAAPQAENAPQPGKTPPAPAAKPAAELSPAAKQAAARLAPVNGKRTAPTQAAPATFDDAFKQYAEAG